MSNGKNQLQEYCMKNKIALPEYETKNIGDKTPLWLSTVTADGKSVTGNSELTKTGAEISAASLLLSNLSPAMKITKVGEDGIYLLDLENAPLVKGQKPTSNQIWIGFLSSHHGTRDKYSDWRICDQPLYNYKWGIPHLYVFDNQGRKDMMDHFITAFTYPIALYLKDNEVSDPIYIVSKDLAAWCSKACLQVWLDHFQLSNPIHVLAKLE